MILYSAIDLTKPPVRYIRNNNRKAIPIRWSVLMHIQDPRIIRDPVHSRTSPNSYPNGKFQYTCIAGPVRVVVGPALNTVM